MVLETETMAWISTSLAILLWPETSLWGTLPTTLVQLPLMVSVVTLSCRPEDHPIHPLLRSPLMFRALMLLFHWEPSRTTLLETLANSIDAGSADVTFSSTIGASTAIGALTVLGNDLDLSGGNIEATGDVILVANNPGADAESITFSGRAIDANGGNVFLSADNITFGAGLASTGASGTTTLTIVGDTAASTITVAGGAGSDANLEISEADLATIGSDFSDVRIGMANADGTVGGEAQADQSGTITMNAGDGTLNFSAANLSLRGIAATTTITSAINTSGASGKTLDLEGTAINLNGDLTTDGAAITFTGPVTVNQGGATAVGTGCRKWRCYLWINTCIDQWRK